MARRIAITDLVSWQAIKPGDKVVTSFGIVSVSAVELVDCCTVRFHSDTQKPFGQHRNNTVERFICWATV